MQIISGKYRARKLIGVDASTTRPTLARVKESIFNLIQGRVNGSVVLDLFSGSGAFGIECVSRYAKKVYMVDFEQKAIDTIKINTKNMVEDFEILKLDYLQALQLFSKNDMKFDIIYLDPPYKSSYALESLKYISENNLLSENGIIIVEHEQKNDLQNIPKCYIIEKSRKYGIAYIDIISQTKE